MAILSCCSGLQGNVILTDANYEILTLLRSHRDDNKGISFMARHAYPIHSIRLYTPLEMSQLQSALESADDKQNLRGDYCDILVMLMVQETLLASTYHDCKRSFSALRFS